MLSSRTTIFHLSASKKRLLAVNVLTGMRLTGLIGEERLVKPLLNADGKMKKPNGVVIKQCLLVKTKLPTTFGWTKIMVKL